jgi:dTDP-4-dehydrorhamnose 3,5-epimerase
MEFEMAPKFTPTDLPEVILIEPEVWSDERGHFAELFHERKYRDGGMSIPFVQDNFSFSRRGTLRGLHFQVERPQAKLVTAVSGEIFDVAVDLRRDSPNFGKWAGVHLSGESKRQLLIPAGFAHGFCVLSESAGVHYKCSALYEAGDDHGILWSDPDLAIRWPIAPDLISQKDRELPKLAEFMSRRG